METCDNLKSIEFSGRSEINIGGPFSLYHSHRGRRAGSTFEIVDTDRSILKPSKVCHTLQSLRVFKCNTLTDSTLRNIADCAPNLTSVCISECDCGTEFANEYLTEKCAMLTDISVVERVKSTRLGNNVHESGVVAWRK
jgi:hypothetical protein